MEVEVRGEHGILTIVSPREMDIAEIRLICRALRAEQIRIVEEMRQLLYGESSSASTV